MNVIDLTAEGDFDAACHELWRRVSRAYSPDLLVGIATGGTRVADAISAVSGLPLVVVRRQRAGTRAKHYLRARALLGRLPRPVTNRLRVAESVARETFFAMTRYRRASRLVTIESSSKGVDAIGESPQILVLDDAVDSGSTLLDVIEELEREHPSSIIRTAVLSSTFRRSAFNPDFVLHQDSIVRGPWAMDR